MKALKKLFVAIRENEVIAYGTNVKEFVKQLNDMGISDRNYAYFNREFNKYTTKTITGADGCEYHLQKVK